MDSISEQVEQNTANSGHWGKKYKQLSEPLVVKQFPHNNNNTRMAPTLL